MNSGALAKSLTRSLYRSVSVWGLTTLLLSWATVSSARPTSTVRSAAPSSSALSASPKQATGGCQAFAKTSASNWQISAPHEPNWTKPDEIVQIGLRNTEEANVGNDRVVARVVAPDGSLAAAYPTVNGDRVTYLTYPLDFSDARPTQAGTYTVVLEVNGQSVQCDRFVVANPSLIDTAFDNDLTGRKLELDLESFLHSDVESSESLLLASNPSKTHNRLFSLSWPSNLLTINLNLDTDNLLSPDPNPIVKETASSENPSSKSESCFYTSGNSFNLSSWQDNTETQQRIQKLEEVMKFLGCRSSSVHFMTTGDFGRSWIPELDAEMPEKLTTVVEPTSSIITLLFLTTLTWMGWKKK